MEQFSLMTVLGYAFVGGVILNAMPCVFPMLGIKLMSVVKKADATPASIRMSGILYTLGVIASFLIFAGIIAVLKEAGKNVGWGFQLQSPTFIAFLAMLFLMMSLSFLGHFEVTIPTWFLPQGMQRNDGLFGEFMAGVMVGLVASPCTAPFMASALGFALAQPVHIMMLVFTMLGFGLGAPFLLLTVFPGMAKFLPRPGQWMVTLRQVLAFPLLLTVIWLLWVFNKQMGADQLALLLCAMVAMVFILWTHKTMSQKHWLFYTVVLTLAMIPFGYSVNFAIKKPKKVKVAEQAPESQDTPSIEKHGVKWHPFSQSRIEQLVAEGKTVFVDFTASWCITCQSNAQTIFGSDDVLNFLSGREDVSLVLADWTEEDDAITKALEAHGRSGVPLYLVYKPGEEVQVLPQILTPSIFLSGLE